MKQRVGRRQQVLDVLRGSRRSRTVSEIARLLRVHGNTVRFHLESLLADGLIEVEEQDPGDRPVGRPAVRYRAIARVAPAQMRHTETLVKLFLGDLASDPDGVQRAEEIGKRWGQSQAEKSEPAPGTAPLHRDVQALTSLLGDMGFESDPPSNSQILVKSCPFLDDAQLQRLKEDGEPGAALPPVCAVHLGVIKGALEQWDADLGVNELTPFSRVDRCRIGLTRKK